MKGHYISLGRRYTRQKWHYISPDGRYTRQKCHYISLLRETHVTIYPMVTDTRAVSLVEMTKLHRNKNFFLQLCPFCLTSKK